MRLDDIRKRHYILRKIIDKIEIFSRRNKFFLWMLKLFEEINTYAYFFIEYFTRRTNNPLTKFIIFSEGGRTGSVLLRGLLDSHPQIRCEDEILAYRLFSLKSFIKIKYALSKKEIYGFKLFLSRLIKEQKSLDPKRFVYDLHKQGWKIICLTRRNVLRQAIAVAFRAHRKKCGKSGRHRIADGPYKLEKVYIDCNKLIRRIKKREALLTKKREILEELPHITVVYEDDLLRTENHQKTLNRIFDYLDVPSVPVKADLVRLTSDRLSDFIQNHEEVVRFISNTEYAKFL